MHEFPFKLRKEAERIKAHGEKRTVELPIEAADRLEAYRAAGMALMRDRPHSSLATELLPKPPIPGAGDGQ